MAISGPIKISFSEAFPYGAAVLGELAPLADFDASTKENRVQARDKDTGLPLWTVDCLDLDPEAREKTFRVKVAGSVMPTVPDTLPDTPIRPVVLEGLTVTPYLKEGNRPRIGYSFRATGLSAPRRAGIDKAA